MSWRADSERRPSNKQTLSRRFEFEAEIHFRRNLSPEDLTEEFSTEEFLGLIPLSPFPCQKQALVLTHFSPCPVWSLDGSISSQLKFGSCRAWSSEIRTTIMQLRARTTKIWTAVAACRGEAQRRLERSGDTAFRTAGCVQKRRGASLPAAVQNPWLRRKPR